MDEFSSVQCADSNYCCDYFKYSRQMANTARQSSAKRSLRSLNTKLTILLNFPCAIEEIKTPR